MEGQLNNIFEDEFKRIANNRTLLVLNDLLKLNLLDDSNEYKLNIAHIRNNKLYLHL